MPSIEPIYPFGDLEEAVQAYSITVLDALVECAWAMWSAGTDWDGASWSPTEMAG